jgi:hypothetical protein
MSSAGPQPTATSTRYEDMLRAVGHLLDTESWQDIRILETPNGLRITARHAGEPDSRPVSFTIEGPHLDGLIRAQRARKGASRASALLAAADAVQRG